MRSRRPRSGDRAEKIRIAELEAQLVSLVNGVPLASGATVLSGGSSSGSAVGTPLPAQSQPSNAEETPSTGGDRRDTLTCWGVHIGACDLKAFESDLGNNFHTGYVSGIDKGHDTGVVDLGTKQPDG